MGMYVRRYGRNVLAMNYLFNYQAFQSIRLNNLM
jgi:hypothetical protein